MHTYSAFTQTDLHANAHVLQVRTYIWTHTKMWWFVPQPSPWCQKWPGGRASETPLLLSPLQVWGGQRGVSPWAHHQRQCTFIVRQYMPTINTSTSPQNHISTPPPHLIQYPTLPPHCRSPFSSTAPRRKEHFPYNTCNMYRHTYVCTQSMTQPYFSSKAAAIDTAGLASILCKTKHLGSWSQKTSCCKHHYSTMSQALDLSHSLNSHDIWIRMYIRCVTI